MFSAQIEKIGDSAALLLTEEILEMLNIHLGDKVNITIEDHKLVIFPLTESEREQKIGLAIRNVFKRRESAYQKLAEGVHREV